MFSAPSLLICSGAAACALRAGAPEWSDLPSIEESLFPVTSWLGLGSDKPLLAGGIKQSPNDLTCLVLVAVER